MGEIERKARWAAQRAEALERQAKELAAIREADWRRRQQLYATQDRLRTEAARFRQMARRFTGEAA